MLFCDGRWPGSGHFCVSTLNHFHHELLAVNLVPSGRDQEGACEPFEIDVHREDPQGAETPMEQAAQREASFRFEELDDLENNLKT